MVEFIIDVAQCLVAVFFGHRLGQRSKELPHKFECMGAGCHFKVSGTSEDFVQMMVVAHLETAHPQGY